MAGVKRRSGYRKTITDETLHGLPEPQEGQIIVRLLGARGSNLFEVESERGDEALALLPTKFRKTVWVKRGDYCIVSEGERGCDTAGGEEGRVRYMIDSVLYPPAVKHLRGIGRWPPRFEAAATATTGNTAAAASGGAGADSDDDNEDGEGEAGGAGAGAKHRSAAAAIAATAAGDEEADEDSDENDDSGIWVNRNRVRPGQLPPSDDEDEDDEDEEEEAGGGGGGR